MKNSSWWEETVRYGTSERVRRKGRRTTLSERSAEKYWSIVSVYRTLTAVFREEIRNSVTCFGGLLVRWLLVTRWLPVTGYWLRYDELFFVKNSYGAVTASMLYTIC